jgi:hypothetical protein
MLLEKEQFEQGILDLKSAVGNIESKISFIEHVMVSKEDLKGALDAQTQDMQDYNNKAFELQQDLIDERFNDLAAKQEVRDRVTKLELDMAKLKLARHTEQF